jgi:hypothetical protein
MGLTIEDVEEQLTYHSLSSLQLARSGTIRSAAQYFARVVMENTTGSADQSAAIRHIRDALMTANAAIALEK